MTGVIGRRRHESQTEKEMSKNTLWKCIYWTLYFLLTEARSVKCFAHPPLLTRLEKRPDSRKKWKYRRKIRSRGNHRTSAPWVLLKERSWSKPHGSSGLMDAVPLECRLIAPLQPENNTNDKNAKLKKTQDFDNKNPVKCRSAKGKRKTMQNTARRIYIYIYLYIYRYRSYRR